MQKKIPSSPCKKGATPFILKKGNVSIERNFFNAPQSHMQEMRKKKLCDDNFHHPESNWDIGLMRAACCRCIMVDSVMKGRMTVPTGIEPARAQKPTRFRSTHPEPIGDNSTR